jgi:acyl carrier protein
MSPTAETVTDQITRIFSDVLGVEVDADSDFFAMGGQSLQGVRIIARLEKLGFTVSIADLFDHSTPRQLAECTTASRDTRQGT